MPDFSSARERRLRGRSLALVVATLPALVLALVVPGAPMAETSVEGGWERDPGPHGMISVTRVHANHSAGPSTHGLRVGYGYFGAARDDYPWGELWVAFHEDGDVDVMAGGLSAIPAAILRRRLGLGVLVDLGVMRRREGGRSDFAGSIGAGFEAVFRASRRWDLVATAEAFYHTTSDAELQGRLGLRFHHERLPSIRGGSRSASRKRPGLCSE